MLRALIYPPHARESIALVTIALVTMKGRFDVEAALRRHLAIMQTRDRRYSDASIQEASSSTRSISSSVL